jgi:chemotaxis protein MotB
VAPRDPDEDDALMADPLAREFAEGSENREIAQLITLEERSEENQEKLWMIPFADLMSTLVILFLALFGYAYMGSSTDYERALSALQDEITSGKDTAKIDALRKEVEAAKALEDYFEQEKLKDVAHVEVNAQRIRVSLSNPVLFASGRADLADAGAGALGQIAALLKSVPNPVVVEGHTDDVPIKAGPYKSNFELSAARSFAVIESFINQGLDPARFSAYGYGEFRPVADNATPDGRARNRRIEINIERTTEKS